MNFGQDQSLEYPSWVAQRHVLVLWTKTYRPPYFFMKFYFPRTTIPSLLWSYLVLGQSGAYRQILGITLVYQCSFYHACKGGKLFKIVTVICLLPVSVCLCLCVCVQFTYANKRTMLRSWFFPSIRGILETELRLSCSVWNAFSGWAILPVQRILILSVLLLAFGPWAGYLIFLWLSCSAFHEKFIWDDVLNLSRSTFYSWNK